VENLARKVGLETTVKRETLVKTELLETLDQRDLLGCKDNTVHLDPQVQPDQLDLKERADQQDQPVSPVFQAPQD